MQAHRFDIVHAHAGGGSARLAARAASRARIVAHLHALNSHDDQSDIEPATYRLAWDADAIIATSRAVAGAAIGTRPTVVYPGVAVSNDRPSPPAVERAPVQFVIGVACRLVPIKGLLYLIRAVGVLRARFPELRLEIVGSGRHGRALQGEVQQLRLADRVQFLGWRTDVEEVLKRWDVFVLPSLQEAFGIAALEAMAAGLPVIASRVGGLPELVEHGQTGWLVPPAHPAALADCISMLLQNPMRRHAMGVAAKLRAECHFGMQRMVAGVEAVYDRLVSPMM